MFDHSAILPLSKPEVFEALAWCDTGASFVRSAMIVRRHQPSVMSHWPVHRLVQPWHLRAEAATHRSYRPEQRK